MPLVATGPAVAPVKWSDHVVGRAHGHPPGCDGRLSLKLYGHPDRQHRLLTRRLPSLLGDLRVARWWFVRYRDPEEHLRIRLALAPGSLGSAVERVGTWTRQLRDADLITHASWDTYYPETARFGGTAAIDAAEEFFAADSAAAVSQLAAQDGKDRPDVRAVVAASLVDIAVALIGSDAEAMDWLIAHAHTDAIAPPRAVYDQAVALSTAAVHRTADSRLDSRIAASWAVRREALAAYRDALERTSGVRPPEVLADLLHLHHVRMSGPGLSQERAHLHLARAAALSWRAREKRTA